MFSTIKLGGRITVILTLIWSICLFFYLNQGLLSGPSEVVVGVMTMPLGMIEGIHYVFLRRGVIGLDELYASLAMMIPNLFILGYGLAACCKLSRRLVVYLISPSSDPASKSGIQKPNKA